MKYETKKEATRQWIGEWNAHPQWMIEKMIGENHDNWQNVTPVTFDVGDDVLCSYDENDLTEHGELYTIKEINTDDDTYMLEVGDLLVKVDRSDIEKEEERPIIPMWSVLWSMGEDLDHQWINENLEKIASCGIEIFEYDDGYNQMHFLGINGCGYDFYESHWIPLYEQRGLQWHSEN